MVSTVALAVPEADIPRLGPADIAEYYWNPSRSHFVDSGKGVRLHYQEFAPADATKSQDTALVIFPGRTESGFRYAELVYDWRELGVTIFILDARGQGLSQRLVPDRDMGYVEDFQDYVDDTFAFFDQVLTPRHFRRVLALSHSMGGTILGLAMAQRPHLVERAVLSAPMLDLPAKPFPAKFITRMLLALGDWGGLGAHYVPGHGKFSTDNVYHGTTSPARFQLFHSWRLAHRDEVLGGASFRWAHKAFVAGQRLRETADAISTPMLLLPAGEENVVDNATLPEFCARAKSCTTHPIAGALHEIHLAADAQREEWLQAVRGFLGF